MEYPRQGKYFRFGLMKIFEGRKGGEEYTPQVVSLIKGTTLCGDIMTENNIRVECDVKGKILTSGRIVVSEQARVDGNIQCGSALVLGLVKGNIVSSGEVALRMPAKVLGNILAAIVDVEKGVVISGMCRIKEDDTSPRSD